MGTESLGTYGRVIAQSLTIYESIQLSRKFIASYNSGLQIWLERHGDQVRYCQKYVEELPRDRITEVVHLGLANAMANSGYGGEAGWQLNRIELASDPIDLSAYFPELADVHVSFRQPITSLWVDTSVMSAPIRRLDVTGCSPADALARDSFLETGPASDPIGQLNQAIESVLDQPGLTLQQTAAAIGTSARTFQRRLAEHDTSFSRLLQAIRFRNAQSLLADPEMSLKEIARRLGYTDLANFIRAFKRWTGVGPNEFRRAHYK
jgi:AraC-like DNA-binding protein